MRFRAALLRCPHPMVLAIAATFCAAALVLFFQHRAVTALQSQTRVILRQISEQTASDIAMEVRRTLDGPVFETLTAVNHPELRAGRLDLVAMQYADALREYPHVDRFLVWSAETQAVAPGEALFYSRDRPASSESGQPLTAFRRDPPLGRAIVRLARQHKAAQQIYVVGAGIEGRYQVFLRLFWTDARRLEYFEVLGFVVDPQMLRDRLFPVLHERRLGALLKRRGGDVPLTLRVTDEHGGLVFGDPVRQPTRAAVSVPMLFYPVDRIDSRLATTITPSRWIVEVGAPDRGVLGGLTQGYWPTALSVVLMLVALGLTVQANRRSADLAGMQADFISHVSHQLKTPLSLLSAATETVEMDRARSPEKMSQYLGIIRNEVARLSGLVQRILEFSRLHQQRGYEFEPIDLGALVRETVAAFASSLSSQFTFGVEQEGGSLYVLADPAAIEQALVNLLDNAVKYSRENRDISVRVRTAGSRAAIEVTDRGIGIEKADERRIFEKFYRGRGASVQRDGFGLGLPIVQELVHAHGGRVEVESTRGEGSTFRILLPLAQPESAERASMAGDVEHPHALSGGSP